MVNTYAPSIAPLHSIDANVDNEDDNDDDNDNDNVPTVSTEVQKLRKRRKRKLVDRMAEAKQAFDGETPVAVTVSTAQDVPNKWLVPSFKQKDMVYEVTYLPIDDMWTCNCKDSTMRHRICKHIMLVRLEAEYKRRRLHICTTATDTT